MSSILDALSKLDPAHGERHAQLPLPPVKPPRRRGPAGIALLVVAGVALGGLALRGQRAEPPAPPPVPAAPAAEAPAAQAAIAPSSEPAAPVPVTPHGLAVVAAVPPPTSTPGDRPWIRTDAPPPPARTAATAPAPTTTAPPAPPPTVAAPAVAAARGVLVAPKPATATTNDAVPVGPPPSVPTLAGVHISFLAYSRNADLRTVSLALDGDSLVTLREGEKSGDLEVLRIRPDRVDVRRNGEVFTIPAGR